MHPQLIAFVVATRKAELKPPLRKIAAQAIVSAATATNLETTDQSNLAKLFNKDLFEALKEFGFDFKEARGAKLVQDEPRYEEINHLVMVCSHVAAAPSDVMEDLASLFTEEHWEVWSFMQELSDNQLESLHARYSALGRSDKHNWSQQKGAMEGIKPPVVNSQ